MKTLSPVQFENLLPEELTLALKAFNEAAPIQCRKVEDLQYLVREGFIEAHVVTDQAGRESHLVAWHQTPDSGFWLDIVLARAHPIPQGLLIKIIEGIAISKGAKYLRWVTMRRGIVKWAQQAGYIPEAVILTKVL